MKCKRGDIAIVLSGCERGNAVTCVELLEPSPGLHTLAAWIHEVWRPVWVVDRQIKWMWQGAEHWAPYVPDRELMPIGNLETPIAVEQEETA